MAVRILAAFLLGMTSICGPAPGLSAFGQTAVQAPPRRIIVLGRKHPGKITGLEGAGIIVDLRNGGTQVVQFNEIWRIRAAYASDEPPGTTVIDFANNRLFVATPLGSLVSSIAQKIPLTQLTAPNGDPVYLVADKVTDVSRALPGLHNPLSKTVIGTRDGTQQVLESLDDAKRMIAAAHPTQ